MCQAIEERGGQLLVAGEDGDPFGKREIPTFPQAIIGVSDQKSVE